MHRYIGIDPGKTGGIAVIDETQVKAFKMPEESDILPLLNEYTADMGMNFFGSIEKLQIEVYIEDLPKGISSEHANFSGMAKLHRHYGFLMGLLTALKVRHHLVRPQVWQKGIPDLNENVIGDDGKKKSKKKKGQDLKRALKNHACRLFPETKCTLSNSDALLIAEYGRSQ